MTSYTEASLNAAKANLTTFRAEGGYITFYTEADYLANKFRNLMTPLSNNLFTNGLTLNETISEHPPVQAFGSDYENLTAFSMVKSTLALNALYVQEGSNPAWMAAGHPVLIAYIDYFMSQTRLQSGDVANANFELEQTIVVRNLRISSRSIAGADSNGVSYQLSFNGGRVTKLAVNTMDLP